MNGLAKKQLVQVTRQHGSVVIFFLIMLPILIATMGLALDVGKFFIVKSELQNAADACALAAAYELDGTSSQFTRANAAGLNLAAKNNVYFQQGAVAGTTVQFSTTATGGYANPAPANASFVRCNVSQPNVATWFIQMVGIGNQTIPATAVASNVPGQTTCALPIGVCSTDLPLGTHVGAWVSGVIGPQGGKLDGIKSGQFKWVDFNGNGGGANELANILSGAAPANCNLSSINQDIGESGFKASLRDDYNTRFGIVKKNAKAPYITDFVGKGYYNPAPAMQNRYYGDYVNQLVNNTPYSTITIPAPGIDIGTSDVLTSGQLKTYGSSRRVALAPVVDCTTMKAERWACMFLLHPVDTKGNDFTMYLEYLGNPSTQATPCGNSPGFASSSDGIGPRVSTLIQ